MKKQAVTETINKGISFLERTQQPDGCFASFSFLKFCDTKLHERKTYCSVFPVALILSCLNELPNVAQTAKTKRKIAKFLLAQKSEHWSFNYWARDAQESITMPYPDDLDDTFCTLAALHKHDSRVIDASALAKIVSLLTFMEEKEGGPYRTWLTPPDAPDTWADVDLAVNSNVAYFLSLQEVSLPGILSFVEKAIDAEDYSSPYYPSAYPIIYFISRFYTGEKNEKIWKFLFQKQSRNGAFENPLNTALSVSGLLRLGADPKDLGKSIAYLIQRQKNGAWEASAFCLDPAIEGRTYYAGSAALTTAFCIEALALYQRAVAQKTAADTITKKKMSVSEKIIKQAKKKFSSLGEDLKKEALARLEKTLLSDKDGSILLLPYFFAESLGKNAAKISDDLIASLCLANLYGWMAYTIYDDFLDDEGEPKLLSLANVCLRELTAIFLLAVPKNADFSKMFTAIMDELDSANAWEIANCRTKNTRVIPEYGNLIHLAERSLGHALGPIAILCSLGYSVASPEIKHAKKFFENYLIARQLNDDAHDWEEDIKLGHINAVGAKLIRRMGKKTLPEAFSDKEILAMQKIFWNETIDGVAEEILSFGKSARKHLQKMEGVQNTALFEKLLLPIENAAKEALKEKEQTLAFLKAY